MKTTMLIIVLVAMACSIGCQTVTTADVAAMKGRHVREATYVWGSPTKTADLGGGEMLYTWEFRVFGHQDEDLIVQADLWARDGVVKRYRRSKYWRKK